MAKIYSKFFSLLAASLVVIGTAAAMPASWFLISQGKAPKHLLK